MIPRCTFLIALLLVASRLAPAQENLPVNVQRAEALDPEDIGVYKYVFEASPPPGKVMVLRCTTTYKGRSTTRVFESIHLTNGKPVRETVLVLDPSKFPFREHPDAVTSVIVRAQQGEELITNEHLTTRSFGGSLLALTFADDQGHEEHLTYKCFLEDYASAKARVPRLADNTPDGTWDFNDDVPQK